MYIPVFSFFFFFNDTATPEIYTLSLHDALPISVAGGGGRGRQARRRAAAPGRAVAGLRRAGHRHGGARDPGHDRRGAGLARSEEHTSELQSRQYLVCRLLLEKKKKMLELSTQEQ